MLTKRSKVTKTFNKVAKLLHILANGYKNCITYDVDTLDYQDPTPAAIVSNCLKAARNGSIISLHFGHANTVKALPAIIAGLKKANLAPVTLSTLLA